MKAYVVAFCGVLLATPALAEPSGTNGNTASSSPNASQAAGANHGADRAHDAPRQICRREADSARRLGGHLICHTAEEWRQIQNDN